MQRPTTTRPRQLHPRILGALAALQLACASDSQAPEPSTLQVAIAPLSFVGVGDAV